MQTRELAIVIPVYNEQPCLRKVINEWFLELENWTENFCIFCIDDGSTDGTPEVMERLSYQLGERFIPIRKKNEGHGKTCLAGYRLALDTKAEWILQIDSDGQCDPQFFFRLWNHRHQADIHLAIRKHRDDGWKRSLISRILSCVILGSTGCLCPDANVPYRLMRSTTLTKVLPTIPNTFDLANVALSVQATRNSSIRKMYYPIRFRERYGGEPSVPIARFGIKARELIRDLRRLKP